MAQRVLLVCDLHDDDRTGADTVAFGVDGSSYQIDLCAEHAGKLRDAVAPYVGAARRAAGGGGGGRRTRRGRAGGVDRQRTQDMREWARGQGHKVSDRGRIPGWIVQKYDAAH